MLLNLLFTILCFLVGAMGMVVVITVHEFAHAPSTWFAIRPRKRWTATPTAAHLLGRLLMLLMAGFGWGASPYNLRYRVGRDLGRDCWPDF